MSDVFAAIAPPSTEAQRRYLVSLLAQRFREPSDVPEALKPITMHPQSMNMYEISQVIDVVKQIPTIKERFLLSARAWMLGDGVLESEVEKRWDAVLERHFHIRREVSGKHFTGKTLRIDRLLKPKGWQWRCGHEHEIGFEIKAGYCSTDVAQAADYANTRWDGTPDEYVIVGLYRADNDLSRSLASVGCFAFSVDHHYSDGLALNLHWNGTRMWTGSLMSGSRDIPRTKWCPSRKFGSR